MLDISFKVWVLFYCLTSLACKGQLVGVGQPENTKATKRKINIFPLWAVFIWVLKVIGPITVFDAVLTGRQSGLKLQCLYGNPIANNFFQNWIFHNLWIKTLKYLKIAFTKFEGCSFPISRWTNFFNFPYRQMYGKLEKLTECLLAKLHPSNLVNKIF